MPNQTTQSEGDKIMSGHGYRMAGGTAEVIDAAISSARAEGAEAMREKCRRAVYDTRKSGHTTIPAINALNKVIISIDAIQLDPKPSAPQQEKP